MADTAASKKVIDETRKLYSNLLAKPLSEKQLARPPFKFIQDLAKSLITETKILRDVYTPADFDVLKKDWNRREKIVFIQKLIDYAANNKQPVTNCVASRVLSGLEANKTNELLQSLAKIALIKRSASSERRPRTFVKPLSGLPVGGPATLQSPKATSKLNPSGSGAKSRISRPIKPTSIEARRKSSGQPSSATSQRSRDNSAAGQKRSPPPTTNLKPADHSLQSKPLPESIPSEQIDSVAQRSKRRLDSLSQQMVKSEKPEVIVTKQVTLEMVTESDIDKNFSFLRSSLRGLRSTMADIGKFEEMLEEELNLAASSVY